jgi:subtilisin family serine protease
MVSIIALIILAAGGADAGRKPAGHRNIVVFREGTPQQDQREVVKRHGFKMLHSLKHLNAASVIAPDDDEAPALEALRGHPLVKHVEKDIEVRADHVVSITPVETPQPEIFPWGVQQIGVPPVFKLIISYSSSIAPTVAVVDTGIDQNHPEFVDQQQIVGGYNALTGENPLDYQDHNGHGTHMAGIIAAAWDGNGQGIIGTAAPKIVAVKVLDNTGHGYLSDLVNGLQWVYDHHLELGIRVVNMSLSFSEDSPLLAEVIEQLATAEVIMVASIGNRCTGDNGGEDEGGDSGCDSSNAPVRYPAAYPQVVAVAATDIYRHLTDYSRSGPEVDLAAPGGDEQSGPILSTTIINGYGTGTGTSQAAAHVSGAAAVALQLAPELSRQGVVDLLKNTAQDLGYSEPHQGAGLVAIDQMVESLLKLP